MIERRLERLKTSGRHGTQAEREAERARGGRPATASSAGWRPARPIRDVGLDDDEAKAIRGFRFLTEKPVLVLLNVGEGDLATARRRWSSASARRYDHQHAMVDALSAKIEMELGELDPDEARRCSWRSWASPSRASSA